MACFYFVNKDSIYWQLQVCGFLVFRAPELLLQRLLALTASLPQC